MKDKIEILLKICREKFETANTSPCDFVACIRLEAQISILEMLYLYAIQEEK